jgi:hypothetical protein
LLIALGPVLSAADAATILIDLGKSTEAFTTETPADSADTWNNFAPVAGGTNGAINAGDGSLTDLQYADGTTSAVDFGLTAGFAGGQGIGAADWTDDFSGTFGYPVSATRDTFYANANLPGVVEFTFSDLATDGTRYDLTVFGALTGSARPNTIIRVGAVDMAYDPNDPGEVTFTNLLPDVSGNLSFSVRRADSSAAAAHINVVTLSEVAAIPEPATMSMLTVGALALIRRRSTHA